MLRERQLWVTISMKALSRSRISSCLKLTIHTGWTRRMNVFHNYSAISKDGWLLERSMLSLGQMMLWSALVPIRDVDCVCWLCSIHWHMVIASRVRVLSSSLVSGYPRYAIKKLSSIYTDTLKLMFDLLVKSPRSSGLSLIALLLSNVLFVIAGGIVTSRVGYYTPILIIGAAVAIVGAALISTWTVDTSRGQWIGYQVCEVCPPPLPQTHIRHRSSSAPALASPCKRQT